MNEEEKEGYLAFLTARKAEIEASMAAAAARAGRDVSEVTLLAVSKTVGVDEVALAWQAGYAAFGENRPQELRRKLDGIATHPEMAGVRFDMIGNLQTNKINQVIGHAALIHSVSSIHLAEALSKRSEARGLTSHVLIEVNVSGEESKSGFSAEEAREQAENLRELGGIEIEGLMTMAPQGDAEAARRTFCGLRELRDELRARTGLALGVLSAGMSDDYEIAIEEGSTIVRLGRTVFSPTYAFN